jgi:hypothetical protein
MAASEQVVRHAVSIMANRLLIQEIIAQLARKNPKFISEIYDKVHDRLLSPNGKSKRQLAFDAKVDAHIHELLSGAQRRGAR